MKKIFFIKIITTYFLLFSSVVATQAKFFEEGIKLYENNKFEESKIFFEREIVFNPEHEKSYLYLAKIFNENKNEEAQEINLNNVLLLNPQNDEAIYMLTLLKIKQSDYKKAKELIDRFILICEVFCFKENEMQEKFMKLTPENAEFKN